LAQLPDTDSLKVTEDAKDVKVEFSQWTLTLRKVDGGLSIRDPNGRVLVEGIYPHSGRKLTMTERIGAKKEKTWSPSFLTEARGLNVTMTRVGSGVRLAVSGTYFRPQQLVEKHAGGDPNDPLLNQEVSIVKNQEFGVESLVGGYDLEITPKGVLTLHYDYSTKNASGRLSEAGLSLLLPAGLTEFRWIGQGIYAGYPGKDRLNEFGLFHLNRDDLRFQGNRRETELALLTDSEGSGVALAAANADIAVERADDLTLLSHNALISGLGNKGAAAENSIKAEKISQIAGQFMLVPLARPWPDALTRWFGKPAAASGVFRPFYHSYDQ
jgi:beta-galactosidase